MDFQIPSPRAKGSGLSLLHEGPVPPVTSADMERDPMHEYAHAGGAEKAWIRRAVHAERFAAALERELEALRNANR